MSPTLWSDLYPPQATKGILAKLEIFEIRISALMVEELTRFVYTAFLALNFLSLAVEMTPTFQGQDIFYMGELSSAFK